MWRRTHPVTTTNITTANHHLQVGERCDEMSKPGVVMGEDELQALADVRGAPVEVKQLS